MNRLGSLEEPVVAGPERVGLGFDSAREVKGVERLEAPFMENVSAILNHEGEPDELLRTTEHIVGNRLSLRIRVPSHLEFSGIRGYQLGLSRLAQRDNPQNGLTLHEDPELALLVERTMDAAHVEVDQHPLNLPLSGPDGNRETSAPNPSAV